MAIFDMTGNESKTNKKEIASIVVLFISHSFDLWSVSESIVPCVSGCVLRPEAPDDSSWTAGSQKVNHEWKL